MCIPEARCPAGWVKVSGFSARSENCCMKYLVAISLYRALVYTLVIILGYLPWVVAQAAKVVNLHVDTSKVIVLHKSVYGFNTNLIHGAYGYLDPSHINNTLPLNPQLLRFPGGTVANFYRWKSADFDKAAMISTPIERVNRRYKGHLRRLDRLRSGRISFDDFMRLCDMTGSSAVVVVNILTESPEYSAEWVSYARSKKYNIIGWELGNEIYLGTYRDKIPDAVAYINIAKKHAAAMRAVDKNIKLGVAAAPNGFQYGHRRWQRDHLWNKTLAAENFYDALVVHFYSQTYVDRDPGLDQLRQYLFASNEAGLNAALNYYNKLFSGRDLWVTEWNTGHPANRVANTHLHALFAGDFLLQLLQQENITIAGFHLLAGLGKWAPVFSKKDASDPRNAPVEIKRAAYYSMQLVGDALEKSDKRFATQVVGAEQISGVLGYSRKTFSELNVVTLARSQTENRILMLISNRWSNVIKPALTINGRAYDGKVVYKYIAHDDLSMSNGGNQKLRGNNKMNVQQQEWSGEIGNFSIPANSFGVLELE